MNLSIKKIRNICDDIISDSEWVNDSQTRSEYKGICDGLNRLMKHLTEQEKDLGAKIQVYSTWLLQESCDPKDEIEWLVNLVLSDEPTRKKEMLSVLDIYKKHEIE